MTAEPLLNFLHTVLEYEYDACAIFLDFNIDFRKKYDFCRM